MYDLYDVLNIRPNNISWNWRYTQVPVSDRSANMLSRIPTIHEKYSTPQQDALIIQNLWVLDSNIGVIMLHCFQICLNTFFGEHDTMTHAVLLAGVWRSVRWESLWPGGRSTCNLQNHLCIVNQIGTQQFFPFYFQGYQGSKVSLMNHFPHGFFFCVLIVELQTAC